MMSLKYDNFRFSWAVVTEKKKRLNSVYTTQNDKLVFPPAKIIFKKQY